jgi:hypothetical protein
VCLQRTRSSHADSVAKRRTPTGYPECPYTHRQLQELVALSGPCFGALGYTVPEACVGVLNGEVKGGYDAMPVEE